MANVILEGGGFSPEEFANVKLCLETLLSIRAGSQPYDREFGIDFDSVVGFPVDVAKNMLALEIIEKVHIYEPRAEVQSIDFDSWADGQLIPRIHFIRSEG